MPRQAVFWPVDGRLRELSERGAPLKKLLAIVDLELFRPVLAEAIGPNDRAIKEAGFLPMAGQIVEPSPVAAPRQRNTEDEKAAIKARKTAAEIWPDKPARDSHDFGVRAMTMARKGPSDARRQEGRIAG